MTTITDSNVHNIAVKGTFDDCQVRLIAVVVFTVRLNRGAGYRQGTIWRQGFQREISLRSGKLHQLGQDPRPNGILFPFVLPHPGDLSRGPNSICRPDGKLR